MSTLEYRNNIIRADTSKYFPIASNQDILNFMNKEDGQYELRREGFEYSVYNTIPAFAKNWVAKNDKDMKEKQKVFSTALLDCFFTRNYAKTHHWPFIQ